MKLSLVSILPLLAVAAGLSALPAAARSGPDKSLLHVARATRMEQRCNEQAMGVIQREMKGMRPDELVAYAFADTHLKDDTIHAPGAAVRSRGHWYHLSYKCTTSDDGMDIKAFSYKLGAEVPKDQWSAHYLVPP